LDSKARLILWKKIKLERPKKSTNVSITGRRKRGRNAEKKRRTSPAAIWRAERREGGGAAGRKRCGPFPHDAYYDRSEVGCAAERKTHIGKKGGGRGE